MSLEIQPFRSLSKFATTRALRSFLLLTFLVSGCKPIQQTEICTLARDLNPVVTHYTPEQFTQLESMAKNGQLAFDFYRLTGKNYAEIEHIFYNPNHNQVSPEFSSTESIDSYYIPESLKYDPNTHPIPPTIFVISNSDTGATITCGLHNATLDQFFPGEDGNGLSINLLRMIIETMEHHYISNPSPQESARFHTELIQLVADLTQQPIAYLPSIAGQPNTYLPLAS